jgi:hypothetical protein
MEKISVFLASSNALLADRQAFEIEINRKNKLWNEFEVFLHLDIWEDLSAGLSQTRSQDEYNRHIEKADIFILLADTKVGKYTAEEFEHAFGVFKDTNKPFIFTYFKQSDSKTHEASLQTFKNKLSALGHFYARYNDSADLWGQFNKELDRLKLADFARNRRADNKQHIDNRGATIKNQFNGGTFSHTTFK